MKQDEVMMRISDNCRWGNSKRIAQILKDNSDQVDIGYYEDATLFRIAMSHENLDILRLLINFYVATKLKKEQEGSWEYKVAQQKLQTMLEIASGASSNESDELKAIISPYISEPEDSVNETLSECSLYNRAKELSEECDITTPSETSLTKKIFIEWIRSTQQTNPTETKAEYIIKWGVEVAQSEQMEMTGATDTANNGSISDDFYL